MYPDAQLDRSVKRDRSVTVLLLILCQSFQALTSSAIALFLPGEPSIIWPAIRERRPLLVVASVVMILLLLPYCAALIAAGSNNPFIYYRF